MHQTSFKWYSGHELWKKVTHCRIIKWQVWVRLKQDPHNGGTLVCRTAWQFVMLCQNYILQSWTKVLGTVLQYSYFSVISRFPLKTVHPFRIFLQFSLPPPYTKLKLGKNSGYMRPTLFVGWSWGEQLDLCELENASEMQSVPRLLSMIVAYHVDVLRALWCIPSPLLDESKESMCGRLKLSPFFKILLLVKENKRDLKWLHSLFE